METGLIIKPQSFDNFAIVPINVLRDQRLSLGAVGLYAYLFSHSDKFQISIEFIKNAFKDGKASVQSKIKELESIGYLKRQQVKSNEGKFLGYNYLLSIQSNDLKTDNGKNRHRENRQPENQSQSNINNNINTNSNINTINNNKSNNIKNELVLKSYSPIVELFPESYRPKNKYQKEKWLECIDKLDRLDGYSPRKVYYIVKKARQDEFWKSNFYSLLKLRQNNKQGVKFIDIFFEKFAAELKGLEL